MIKFLLFLGNRPPAMIPNKFYYMNTDLKRLSEYFVLPLNQPSNPVEVMFEKGIQIAVYLR